MAEQPLTPAQEAEAEALFARFQQAFLDEARRLARLLASRPDAQLLGRTEFQIRDDLHRLGAQALEITLRERKKKATRAPA